MTRSFWIMVRMMFQHYMIFMASRGMREDEGRQITSLPILAYTADLLVAEYNGYKAYVARQKIKQ